MLEVIDSLEELELLETLTPTQKRQVWQATSPETRVRLKQIRAGHDSGDTAQFSQLSQPPVQQPSRSQPWVNLPEPVQPLFGVTHLVDGTALSSEPNRAIEETAALDLVDQQEEIDLMLQEPLNLDAQPTVGVGDWVILQAKPQLARAELMAIWEVVELQGNYARILAQGLGNRMYPTTWMLPYPKPIDYAEPDF
jgi:hypothetical protein